MSYCQKHKNHHCIHAHNCQDPSHKKKNQRATSASHQNKSSLNNITQKYSPPMGIIIDNEQCHFISPQLHQGSPLQIEAYIKRINSLNVELQLSKRTNLNADIENRKLKQRNSHTQCQIEYLRQQLDLLVSNHNTDISKEIKKSLVEHTNLNIKIKELTSQIFDKQKVVEEMSSENYSLSRKNKQLEASIRGYEEKIKLIVNKNQELSFQFNLSKNKIKQLQSQLKLLKDRYSALANSADRSVKQKQNKLSIFQNQKQKLQRNHKTKQSEMKRMKQLHEVEKKAWQKMIAQFRSNTVKKDDEIKKYRQLAKQTEQNLVQVKQDFEHAKKLILKYQKVNGECQKIREQQKNKMSKNEHEILEQQKKTVSKNQYSLRSDDTLLVRLKQLQGENNQLQNKIRDLENRIILFQNPLQNRTNLYGKASNNQPQNIIINEELILSIGASQQFKKILQQKNVTIKKLMKEKAELYTKIYQQQAHHN